MGQLARSFDQMAERIQTLLAAERRLLLDISHELRSPLARLAVAVELARSGEDAEAALNRIQKEADRLNSLVGELLEVTRAEGDPASLRDEPVRLDEVLRDLVEDCSLEAKAQGCRIELTANPPAEVRGDAELLRRAIENVVRNAIRHAPPNTAVEVGLTKNAGVTVRVRDHGPGIPEEHLPRIFDPFYRVDTDRSRSSGGVGLGLAIARRAVELHRGHIAARNSNPGLLVEIEIPKPGDSHHVSAPE
jgi:two-component system sensor histidine kinase CpxA